MDSINNTILLQETLIKIAELLREESFRNNKAMKARLTFRNMQIKKKEQN